MGEVEVPVTAPDEVSFDDLFSHHYERVLQAMWLMTGDRAEAEDLTQEAFARAYERRDRLSAGGNPVGYVYTAAVNLHRSRLRRIANTTRRRPVGGSSPDPLEVVEDRDRIRRSLAALSRNEREALVLTVFLELSSDEAAAIARATPAAIRTRVSRAKARLREQDDRSDP